MTTYLMFSLHVIRSPPSTRKSIPVTVATTTVTPTTSANGTGTTSPTMPNAGALSPSTNIRHHSRSPTPQITTKNSSSSNHHTVAFADQVQVYLIL